MATEPTVWVEVDINAIRHNYQQVQRAAGSDTAVMAVLKTNAYGHGLDLVARALREDAPCFGVSTVEEGQQIRRAGIAAPVLVFHPAGRWNAFDLVANDLTATVDSDAGVEALVEAGRALGVTPKAHLKMDTGMGRFGVPRGDVPVLQRLFARDDVVWEGVYTHLATATEKDPTRALAQLASFRIGLETLSKMGDLPRWIHALNSPGLLRFPGERHTLVRCGTLLFGQYPAAHLQKTLDLRPTWRLKTRIVSMRNVAAGSHAGYGFEWKAKRASVLATIAVGYYDGFTLEPMSVWRRRSGWRSVARRWAGREALMVKTPAGEAPVAGRVAAQSAILDVTGLQGLKVGDVVEVPARRVLVGDHVPRVPAGG